MRITRRGLRIAGWSAAFVVVLGGVVPIIIGGFFLHRRAVTERNTPVRPSPGLDPMPILRRQPPASAVPEKFLL